MRLLTTIINKQTQPWFAGGPAFKSVLHILNDNLVHSKTRHRAHAKDKRASAGARTEKQQKERLQKEVAKLERTLTREEHAEEHAEEHVKKHANDETRDLDADSLTTAVKPKELPTVKKGFYRLQLPPNVTEGQVMQISLPIVDSPRQTAPVQFIVPSTPGRAFVDIALPTLAEAAAAGSAHLRAIEGHGMQVRNSSRYNLTRNRQSKELTRDRRIARHMYTAGKCVGNLCTLPGYLRNNGQWGAPDCRREPWGQWVCFFSKEAVAAKQKSESLMWKDIARHDRVDDSQHQEERNVPDGPHSSHDAEVAGKVKNKGRQLHLEWPQTQKAAAQAQGRLKRLASELHRMDIASLPGPSLNQTVMPTTSTLKEHTYSEEEVKVAAAEAGWVDLDKAKSRMDRKAEGAEESARLAAEIATHKAEVADVLEADILRSGNACSSNACKYAQQVAEEVAGQLKAKRKRDEEYAAAAAAAWKPVKDMGKKRRRNKKTAGQGEKAARSGDAGQRPSTIEVTVSPPDATLLGILTGSTGRHEHLFAVAHKAEEALRVDHKTFSRYGAKALEWPQTTAEQTPVMPSEPQKLEAKPSSDSVMSQTKLQASRSAHAAVARSDHAPAASIGDRSTDTTTTITSMGARSEDPTQALAKWFGLTVGGAGAPMQELLETEARSFGASKKEELKDFVADVPGSKKPPLPALPSLHPLPAIPQENLKFQRVLTVDQDTPIKLVYKPDRQQGSTTGAWKSLPAMFSPSFAEQSASVPALPAITWRAPHVITAVEREGSAVGAESKGEAGGVHNSKSLDGNNKDLAEEWKKETRMSQETAQMMKKTFIPLPKLGGLQPLTALKPKPVLGTYVIAKNNAASSADGTVAQLAVAKGQHTKAVTNLGDDSVVIGGPAKAQTPGIATSTSHNTMENLQAIANIPESIANWFGLKAQRKESLAQLPLSSMATTTPHVRTTELLPEFETGAGVGEWSTRVVVDAVTNAHHVTENSFIPRDYAVRRMYRDIFFSCDISNIKVVVNDVAVNHQQETLRPPDGQAESHKVIRLAIDGWPGDVVVVRDITLQISYTLHHAAHRLTDNSVMSMIAVPPCSFSYCPAYAQLKASFVVPGLESASGYKAPNANDGHRLPLDAYVLDNVEIAGDIITLKVAAKSSTPPSTTRSPWDTPSPMWMAVVFKSSSVRGDQGNCAHGGEGMQAVARLHATPPPDGHFSSSTGAWFTFEPPRPPSEHTPPPPPPGPTFVEIIEGWVNKTADMGEDVEHDAEDWWERLLRAAIRIVRSWWLVALIGALVVGLSLCLFRQHVPVCERAYDSFVLGPGFQNSTDMAARPGQQAARSSACSTRASS